MDPRDDGTPTEVNDDWGVSRRTLLVGSASEPAVGLAACNGNGTATTTIAAPPPPQEPDYVLADAGFDGSKADEPYPPPTPEESSVRARPA